MTAFSRIVEAVTVAFPQLMKALFTKNMPMAIESFAIGQVLAVLLALARLSKSKVLNKLSAAYVWIIRGVPLIVLLFIVFYGFPYLGITLPSMFTAVCGLALNIGAYDSENYRAAILSVSKGQKEAAKSLGLNGFQTQVHVVLPQALAVALPPLANSFISLTRDTSIISMLALSEVFYTSQVVCAFYPEPLALYIEVGLIFLVLSIVLTWLFGLLEKSITKHRAAVNTGSVEARRA